MVKKMMDSDRKLKLLSAVNLAAWAHNTNVNVLGYDPMSLVTGKAVSFPGVTTGTVATDSSEHIQRIMERHREVGKTFRECEFGRKIEKTAGARAKSYKDMTGLYIYYLTNLQSGN